jgi:hypothetical protein
MREIIFYRTEKGKCPIEEYLNSLSNKQKTPNKEIKIAESRKDDYFSRRRLP